MTQIALDSPAVAHGLGLFETMLVVDGNVMLLDEHLARMTRSAATLGFPLPDAQQFRDAAQRAVKNVRGEASLRCVYVATSANAWTLDAQLHPIPPLTFARRANGRAITLDATFARALPEHKMTSYAPCVIALRRAIAADAEEALFVTRDGLVLEGTATNVFAIANDALITAPRDVLPGIVRACVIDAAHKLGVEVIERCPSIDELRNGAFLTGSLTLLAPLRVLDGEPCRDPGTLFRELQRNVSCTSNPP